MDTIMYVDNTLVRHAKLAIHVEMINVIPRPDVPMAITGPMSWSADFEYTYGEMNLTPGQRVSVRAMSHDRKISGIGVITTVEMRTPRAMNIIVNAHLKGIGPLD